jgi:RNA polymerase sporulation-specific sigma factor
MNMSEHKPNSFQDMDKLSASDGEPSDTLSILSDELLCMKAQSGDSAAADLLIHRFSRLVTAIAHRYYLVGGTKDDLEQEGMIGLLSAMHDYTPGLSSFKTFAGLCIRRSVIDAIRKSHNKNNLFNNDVLSLSQMDPDAAQTYPAEQDPEQQVIGKDDRKHIEQQLLSKLSDFERHVLTLYLNGLRYGEIAEKLSKSTKSVDNAVQRIRRKLHP